MELASFDFSRCGDIMLKQKKKWMESGRNFKTLVWK